jgi:hypothetical protein
MDACVSVDVYRPSFPLFRLSYRVVTRPTECIPDFRFIVTAYPFRLFSVLLFFHAFGLVVNLSKKKANPACRLGRKGHRRPRLNDAVGQGLHPGGGGFPCRWLGCKPDLTFVLL